MQYILHYAMQNKIKIKKRFKIANLKCAGNSTIWVGVDTGPHTHHNKLNRSRSKC